jgi:hypothetical protein
VVGMVIVAGMVASLLTTYALVRVDPSTVLTSCSFSPPAHSCPSPVNSWGVWLPSATGFLGMAAVGVLLIRRHRGHSVPTSN